MNRKNNYVLNASNDEATNFHCKYDIKADFAKQNTILENEQKANNLLKPDNENEYMQRDLITHDFKMPVNNSLELLDLYNQVNEELLSQMVIVLATTSLDTEDQVNSGSDDSIDQFMSKLLKIEILQESDSRLSALVS